MPWSKETATFALPAPGDTAPIVMPSLDPSSATSCFSEAALAAGFVREDGLGIVGASAGAAPLMRRIRELLDKCDDPVSGVCMQERERERERETRRIRELLDTCEDLCHVCTRARARAHAHTHTGKELLPRCLVPMDAQTAYLQAPVLKSPLYVPLCSKCGRALTFQNVKQVLCLYRMCSL